MGNDDTFKWEFFQISKKIIYGKREKFKREFWKNIQGHNSWKKLKKKKNQKIILQNIQRDNLWEKAKKLILQNIQGDNLWEKAKNLKKNSATYSKR